MKIKKLFPTPEGNRITEKYLSKVLVTSICSIFLCMSGLAGTTWAWFAVSIDDAENVIQIGTPSANVLIADSEFESGATLPGGDHMLTVVNANDADAFDQKSTLYVTFCVDQEVAGYVILNAENGYKTDIYFLSGDDCVISWISSWMKPEVADLLEDRTIDLRPAEETESTEETTEETTTPTTEATQPADNTTPPDETTKPTENTTPPDETTKPTENTTPPDETTKPTENTTPPDETTKPTDSMTPPEETTKPTEGETSPEETTKPEEDTTPSE